MTLRTALFALLSICALTLGTTAVNAKTVRHYNDVNGNNAIVTIVWDNISGLGKVSGTWYFAAGEMTFTGNNSRSGYLSIRYENGASVELYKKKEGNTIVWSGGGSRLIANEAFAAVAAPKLTTRTYHLELGAGLSYGLATIYWHNIKGNGRIEGVLTNETSSIPFVGSNPSNGYIEFIDNEGNQYKLRKSASSGSLTWTGQATRAGGGSQIAVTMTAH